MKHYTHLHTHSYSNKIKETSTYTIFQDTELNIRYSSNFVAFKGLVTLEEFIKVREEYKKSMENYPTQYEMYDMSSMTLDLKSYLEANDYSLDSCAILKIKPEDFKANINSELIVKTLSLEDLENYNAMVDEEDTIKRFGAEFAKQKKILNQRIVESNQSELLGVWKDDHLIGTCVINHFDTYLEIDDLCVHPDFRNLRAASTLQSYVMESAQNKDVILVADTHDTPINMYKKQGYIAVSSYTIISKTLV